MISKHIIYKAAIISVALTAVVAAITLVLFDNYVGSKFLLYDINEAAKPNQNYLIEGTYNGTSIIVGTQEQNREIHLNRELSGTLLYKECYHFIGDKVKYAGIFYGKTIGSYFMMEGFAIKREIC